MTTTVNPPPVDEHHVPAASAPGHHPEVEQDKPTRVPDAFKVPQRRSGSFGLAVPTLARLPLALVGVTPWTSGVELTDDEVRLRFGLLSVAFPREDVEEATVEHDPWLLIPGARVLRDGTLVLATGNAEAVRLRLHRPFRGPLGLLSHRSVVVGVDDAEVLAGRF